MEFAQRIGKLQEVIRERHLAGAILFYSRDVYYYTGTAQPSYLIVLPNEYVLFVRRGCEFAQMESDLEATRIITGKSMKSVCERMFPGAGCGDKVGVEMDLLTVRQAENLRSYLRERELVDISGDILGQRMIKDSAEIETIRQASRAVHAGHQALVLNLRAGMSELELAALIEHAQRLAGHEGCFFIRGCDFVMSRGPLASGPNLRVTAGTLFTLSGAGLSSAVPTGPSRRIIENGDLVMVDIPACVEGYHADQSRTYAVGSVSEKCSDLYLRLKNVADHLIENISPGMTCADVYSFACAKAKDVGLQHCFMNLASGAKPHFIGHGVGLEINEPPLLSKNNGTMLQAGMALALEMHLMEPEGPTMKLEDTVCVGSQGNEILTLSPRELLTV